MPPPAPGWSDISTRAEPPVRSPNPVQPAQQVAARLAEACDHPSHAFWPQQISLLQEDRCLSAGTGRGLPQQVPGATASHLCVIAADGSDSGEEAAAPMAP
jgi:hypothetical protein